MLEYFVQHIGGLFEKYPIFSCYYLATCGYLHMYVFYCSYIDGLYIVHFSIKSMCNSAVGLRHGLQREYKSLHKDGKSVYKSRSFIYEPARPVAKVENSVEKKLSLLILIISSEIHYSMFHCMSTAA